MIIVDNLTKKYGKIRAVDHLSLQAIPGEITVLLGDNGAGKSTTIKSIIGLLQYDGHITICGHDNKTVEAKQNFGYIPEVPILYDLLTIDEHVDFIGNAYKIENYKAKAQKFINLFELQEKQKTIAKELSKGMRQKLSMLLAFMTEPKALLIDEPLIGLDPQSIEKVLELLVELKQQGTSILISTHIIDVMNDYWDKAYIMKKGKVIRRVERQDLTDHETLKEIFFEVNKENEGMMAHANTVEA